jgi:hypothetical protein
MSISEDLPECFWTVMRIPSLFNFDIIRCALLGSISENLIKSAVLKIGVVKIESRIFKEYGDLVRLTIISLISLYRFRTCVAFSLFLFAWVCIASRKNNIQCSQS